MHFSLWKKTKKDSLGLELGRDTVTIIHLSVEEKKIQIHQVIQVNIAKYDIETKTEVMLHAIKQAISQLKTRNRQITIALADLDCFSQVFTCNQMANDWKTMALLKIESSIALPLDILHFDFQTIEESDSTAQVLTMACRKQTIHDSINLIKASGLTVTAIEVESHALERSYRYLYDLEKYPDCWSSAMINCDKIILLIWSKHKVLGTFSDYIDVTTSLDSLTIQLYSHLIYLVGMHTSYSLEAIWFIGNHPNLSELENRCRDYFGLSQTVYPQVQTNRLIHNGTSMEFCMIAFGLALWGHDT